MYKTELLKSYLTQIIKNAYAQELQKVSSGGRNARYVRGTLRGNNSIVNLLRNWNVYACYLRATGVPADCSTFFDVLNANKYRFTDVQSKLCNDLLKHFIPSATVMQGLNPGIIIDDPDLTYRSSTNINSSMILNLPIAIYDVLLVLLCIHWTSRTDGIDDIFRYDLVRVVRPGEVNFAEEQSKAIKFALDVQATLGTVNMDLLRMFYDIYDDEENSSALLDCIAIMSIQLGVKWRDVETTQGYVAIDNDCNNTAFLESLANGIRILLKATQSMLEMIGMPLSVYIAQQLNCNEAATFGEMAVEQHCDTDESVEFVNEEFKLPNGEIYCVAVPNEPSLIERLAEIYGNDSESSTELNNQSEATDNTDVNVTTINVGPVFIANNDGTYVFTNAEGTRNFRRVDRGFAERVSVDIEGIPMDIWRPMDGVMSEDDLRNILFAGIPRRELRNSDTQDGQRWELADAVRSAFEGVVDGLGIEEMRVTRTDIPDVVDEGEYVLRPTDVFGAAMERAVARNATEERPRLAADDQLTPEDLAGYTFVDVNHGNNANGTIEAAEQVRRVIDNFWDNVNLRPLGADDVQVTPEAMVNLGRVVERPEVPTTNDGIDDLDDLDVYDLEDIDDEIQPITDTPGRRFSVDDINAILAREGAMPVEQRHDGHTETRPHFRFIDGVFRLVTE